MNINQLYKIKKSNEFSELRHYFNETELILLISAKNGYINIIKEYINKEYSKSVFNSACLHGKLDIVEYLINEFNLESEYNNAMLNACINNHISIIRCLLDCGANNYDECINLAYQKKDKEIIHLLLNYPIEDYDSLLTLQDDNDDGTW